MKAQLGLLALIVILIFSFGVMVYVAIQEDAQRDREIREIVSDKDAIITRDSLNQATFKQVLDSVRIVIRSQRDHAQRLENFNRQIRNQNDELRKIYKALPDNGRPDY